MNAKTGHYARMEGALYVLIKSDNLVHVSVLTDGSAAIVMVCSSLHSCLV
jgi:hypothetical protein